LSFNKKDHHLDSEIRPRFKLVTDLSEDEVFARLKAFTLEDKTVVGKKVLDQFYLDIPDYNERTYWSPELRVTIEKDEYDHPGKTVIRVLVGPRSNVWTLFVFLYSFLAVLSVFGGMYGLSQLNMGKSTPWIWCFPVTLAIIFGVWLIAKIGQTSARDQTLHLVSALYHAIGLDDLERIES
jgi:hypothetical protein